ncbi:testis-expressed protein 47 [Gouania willdenowi]|uniref:testis-expressed protein 47 n=1 Tax=Gouania willdenowi TaxID=441366 RepID=UPI001055B930|nr:testis-expressed protein 47 [Gouania willdenowi]
MSNTETPTQREDRQSVFDVFYGHRREKLVLQRLVVVARLSHGDVDGATLAGHYERLNLQLIRDHVWDPLTGLMMVYQRYLLTVVESSRDILTCVLKDMQSHSSLMKVKVVSLTHDLPRRLFQQWSYKVLDAGAEVKGQEEEEFELLSALQKLSAHMEDPELIVPQSTLEKLVEHEDLLSAQQHLHLYQDPLNISVEFALGSPSFVIGL